MYKNIKPNERNNDKLFTGNEDLLKDIMPEESMDDDMFDESSNSNNHHKKHKLQLFTE